MSVAEIKNEMLRLPAADIADIERFAAELRSKIESASPTVRVVHPSDPDVDAAMKEVFEKHRGLLKRLAQ